MGLPVRVALVEFMETRKKQATTSDSCKKPVQCDAKAILPLGEPPTDPGCAHRSCTENAIDNAAGDCARQCKAVSPRALAPISRASCRRKARGISHAGSPKKARGNGSSTGVPPKEPRTRETSTVNSAARGFPEACNFKLAPRKQPASAASMTGIQSDPRYKRSRYKAHLHIKSIRMYTNSHPTIEMAIDHQIILMQIRVAWMAVWQLNANTWMERPDEFAAVCKNILTVNGTSESELGLKAFVSIQARPWLGKNCFIISPVLELSEALELQGKLLRARLLSWAAFRAEWIELMQCKRHALHARSKVRSAEEAQAVADAAYHQHQSFLKQKTCDRMIRNEAKAQARKTKRDIKERDREIRLLERERNKQERQLAREKLQKIRAERRNAKRYAFLERRLLKAVRKVERAQDLKVRSDAKAEMLKAREERQRFSKGKKARVQVKHAASSHSDSRDQ